MTTIPLSEAKARLFEIADEVGRTHERVRITRNGRQHVVFVAADDRESLEATRVLLADPRAQERVRAGLSEADRDDLLDEEAVRGMVVARRRATHS